MPTRTPVVAIADDGTRLNRETAQSFAQRLAYVLAPEPFSNRAVNLSFDVTTWWHHESNGFLVEFLSDDDATGKSVKSWARTVLATAILRALDIKDEENAVSKSVNSQTASSNDTGNYSIFVKLAVLHDNPTEAMGRLTSRGVKTYLYDLAKKLNEIVLGYEDRTLPPTALQKFGHWWNNTDHQQTADTWLKEQKEEAMSLLSAHIQRTTRITLPSRPTKLQTCRITISPKAGLTRDTSKTTQITIPASTAKVVATSVLGQGNTIQ